MNAQLTTINEKCVGGNNTHATQVRKSRYLLGLCYIALFCIIWIGASVSTQFMFDSEEIDSPFLMTYVGVTLLVFLFPIKYLTETWFPNKDKTTLDATLESAIDSFDEELAKAKAYGELLEVISKRSLQHATSPKQWNHKKHALAAFQ